LIFSTEVVFPSESITSFIMCHTHNWLQDKG